MTKTLWADIDEDWKRKEQRAQKQREANAEALREDRPLPFANPFDVWDPTKLPRDATPEQILARNREFRKICRPPQPKRHTI